MEQTKTASPPAVAPLGRLHWHPRVHREWTGRQMYFWFFTFTALYSPDEVLEALEEVYDDFGITSYMAYELLGSFDMMARVYIEPSREDEFSKALDNALGPLGLTKHQPFQVDKVVRNWVWAPGANGAGEVPDPDPGTLKKQFPAAEIALLNNLEDHSPERRDLITRYAKLGLLTEASRSYGIKFVMLIGSTEEPRAKTYGQVTGRLARAIDKTDLLVERSVYKGRGGQRELFLVICRIEHKRFHELRKGLLEPMGDAVAPIADTRTTTFPVVSEDFLCFQDLIALEEADRAEVSALLEGDETSLFEVKASLFSPLDPWLKEGKELEESKDLPLKGALKAIVGLLNSGGGTVVVGAVEEPRYRDSAAALERLSNYPKVGKHRIVGILDQTYADWGWDGWNKRLRGLIASKIDSNPGVLVQTRPETIKGKEVCVVDIYDPGDEYQFWLKVAADKSVFYARQGTDVVPLHGPEIEEHRRQVVHHRKSKTKAKRSAKRG